MEKIHLHKDGKLVKNYKPGTPITEDGKYSVYASDLAGNKSETIEFVIDKTAPKLVLNGSAEMTVEAGTTYEDQGAKAIDTVDGEVALTPVLMHYSVNGEFKGEVDAVDTMKPGTYKLVYKYTDKAGNVGVDANRDDHDYVMRIVTVVDTTAPKLVLNGDAEVTVEAGTTYEDQGAKAIDTVDGEVALTPVLIHYSVNGEFKGEVDAVDTMKPGTYKLVYKYTDKAGNVGIDANRDDHDYVMRIVTVVDTTAPKLMLNGDANVTVEAGTTYEDQGAKAIDTVDGEVALTPVLIHYSVNGEFKGEVDAVDTMKPGTYKLVYKYTDKAGNVGVDANRDDHDYVMRIVTVVDTTAPKLVLNGDAKMTVEAGTTYEDQGAKAIDIVDGEVALTPVLINYSVNGEFKGEVGAVDTMKSGTYKLVYKYTDKAGNVGVDANRDDHDYVMRIVTVVDTTAPNVTSLRMLAGNAVDGTLNGQAEKVWKATTGDTIRVYAQFDEELGTMPKLTINNKISVDFEPVTSNNGEKYYLAKYTIAENDGLEDGSIRVVITGYADAAGNNGKELTNADMTLKGQREIIIERTSNQKLENEESLEATTETVTTSLEATVETENGNAENGDTTVTLKTTKPVEAPEGWEKVDDTTFTTTLPEGNHSVDVSDEEGNESTIKFSVENNTEATEEEPSTENVVEEAE